MKLLVMSDSHGNKATVKSLVDRYADQVAAVIHLGDGASDAQLAALDHPGLPFHIVCGNCDFTRDLPRYEDAVFGGKRLYLTHGYSEHVKYELLTLTLTAHEHGADAALFGHTHETLIDFDRGMLLFNPGSLGYYGSYGILDVDDKGIVPHIYVL
ncbi:MAG: metallophosphoesterase [Clostridia bacterium]|nr:metallophosphoesterase [Clostridia bacterium]